jgi:hypothetical protein
MAEKHHTVYFELRDSLGSPGCALCALPLRSMRRYFEVLGYESHQPQRINPRGLQLALSARRYRSGYDRPDEGVDYSHGGPPERGTPSPCRSVGDYSRLARSGTLTTFRFLAAVKTCNTRRCQERQRPKLTSYEPSPIGHQLIEQLYHK